MSVLKLVEAYSPWLRDATRATWQETIPAFRRPVFHELLVDLHETRQIVSITGPRRVGKSTLLQQLVLDLIEVEKVDPQRVWYYSMDDPARFRKSAMAADEIIEGMVVALAGARGKGGAYLFLDEIQRADRWELSLKKCYDLKHPVRIVISGSASSPIFKKTRESLLGRVVDHHVLPFSFREFLLYQLGNHPLVQEVEEIGRVGKRLMGMLTRSPEHLTTRKVDVRPLSDELRDRAEKELERYFVDGGFPEVWTLPTIEKKMDYLFDNQVKKVIYEDLTLATEFRKPDELKAFYVSLLEQPGVEVNLERLAREVGINVQQIKKYLPLLEMTDLLRHAEKFRRSAIRMRHGNRRFYLVDMALRNAVLRLNSELLDDDAALGLYAENLVFNALKKWRGVLQIDYYREGNREVDFVVHVRPRRYWPIEVKYRRQRTGRETDGIRHFSAKYPCALPILVTRRDFGCEADVLCLPLVLFLLLID